MAIRRANEAEIDYPNAQTKLEAGDRLLVVGASEELAALEEFAQGKVAVPSAENSSQWVTVNGDSAILGRTLTDLDIHQKSGVQIQAMRRDGKFIRSPDEDTDFRVGDQVLLCGNLPSLNQLQVLFASSTTALRKS